MEQPASGPLPISLGKSGGFITHGRRTGGATCGTGRRLWMPGNRLQPNRPYPIIAMPPFTCSVWPVT